MIKPDIKQIRIDAVLNKQYRFSEGIMTLKERMDKMLSYPDCELRFESCGTYKRQGERFDRKPDWSLSTDEGDMGIKVGKIGASYCNQILSKKIDVDAIEKAGLDKWKRENKPTTPGLHAGYMGR